MSPQDEQEVLRLRSKNLSQSRIAQLLGRHRGGVSRTIKRHLDEPEPDWHKKARSLRAKGFTAKQIAETLNVHPSTVQTVTRGIRKDKPAKTRILVEVLCSDAEALKRIAEERGTTLSNLIRNSLAPILEEQNNV